MYFCLRINELIKITLSRVCSTIMQVGWTFSLLLIYGKENLVFILKSLNTQKKYLLYSVNLKV